MMKLLFFFLLLYSTAVFSALPGDGSFEEIRKNYENKTTGDERALPYIKQYIKKAKKEQNYVKWVQGYRDGVQFSKNVHQKMTYADSTITIALQSKNNELIANAYLGKGIVFYFNMKKFQPALAEYLKAQSFAENTDDDYLKNKIIYHMGVVKSYLRFYEPASEHFKKTISFYESGMLKNKEPIIRYNHKKAYLNSLHQLTVVYRSLGYWKRSDSLIKKGLNVIGNSQEYNLEKAYFFKCRGIAEYHNRQYNTSLFYLDKALPQLLKRDDFAWASVIYFFKGNIFWEAKEKQKAMVNFRNIDSIFEKHQFILPEARPAYEKLIIYSQESEDLKNERYYTRQLIKVEAFLAKDFAFLASKVHRDYDYKKDVQEKKQWQITKITGLALLIISGVITLISVVLQNISREKKKAVLLKYRLLQEKLETDGTFIKIQQTTSKRSELPETVVKELTLKLAKFEKNEGFRNNKLSIAGMAKNMGTNTTYLSVFINETTGMFYKPYIMNLRISYIIKKLNEDKKYRLLTIAALSEDAGFNHRQKFSDAFLESTGLRPTQYIKQLLLDKEKEDENDTNEKDN